MLCVIIPGSSSKILLLMMLLLVATTAGQEPKLLLNYHQACAPALTPSLGIIKVHFFITSALGK